MTSMTSPIIPYPPRRQDRANHWLIAVTFLTGRLLCAVAIQTDPHAARGMRTTGTHHLQSTSCVGAEACFIGAALLAQEPVAFRTVVTTGASARRVQTPATAPSWLGGHYGHRLPPPKPCPHCSPK